jgi:hypothetical protein
VISVSVLGPVELRREDGQVDRTVARSADRQRRQVTDWWTVRHRGLPPAMRTAIVDRHHDILSVLHRPPSIDSRQAAIRTAAASIDWRTTGAADQFVGRLRRLAATGPGHDTAQPAQDRATTNER